MKTLPRRSFLAALAAVISSLGLRRVSLADPPEPNPPEIPAPPTAEGEYVLLVTTGAGGASYQWAPVSAWMPRTGK